MSAREHFDRGIQALGLRAPAVGRAPTRSLDCTPEQRNAARLHFRRAVTEDPSMCDAWVALACAGDITADTFARAAETTNLLHRETRRYGLDDSQLIPVVPVPFIDLYAQTRVGLSLARIAALITGRNYDDAEKLLNTTDITSEPNQEQIHRFLGAALYYLTDNWTDVLNWTGRTVKVVENPIGPATELLAGIAETKLGQFDAAIKTLTAIKNAPQVIAAEASLYQGLCERALGNEEQARALFQRAIVDGTQRPEAATALADPTYGPTTTTSEAIAARTNRWDPTSGPSVIDLNRQKRRSGNPAMLAEARARIDAYIGLRPVKERLAELEVALKWDLEMIAAGEEIGEIESINMTFVGKPGTAKTSMARDVGAEYCGLGLLDSAEVKEASRALLIGDKIGETTKRTLAFLESARGGVAFIDEAPELYKPHTPNDFGREALDTIMKWTEDNRDTLVIMAGYKGPMNTMLEKHNVGMMSRFPTQLEFPSYSGQEMLEILDLMAARSAKVMMDEEARAYWLALCNHLCTTPGEDDHNGESRLLIDVAANGRFARMVITEAALLMKNRVLPGLDLSSPEKRRAARTVICADLRAAVQRKLPAQGLDAALADIAA
ncbi:AAA family ATPase [Mycobacteroides abscessus]|uniref:AAA family ATPase n=1 Tax=Mycobacteroides abscessus TaxID=36809 RepID=UPI0019CF95B9|nr:AAA family ATPase [Mycobacteroides abscessus]QSN49603.1 AAA family ATPase [Mycobacteroides abscessus subsp. abscessus]